MTKLGLITDYVSESLRSLSGSCIREGLKLSFKTFRCVLYSRGSFIRERLIIEGTVVLKIRQDKIQITSMTFDMYFS